MLPTYFPWYSEELRSPTVFLLLEGVDVAVGAGVAVLELFGVGDAVALGVGFSVGVGAGAGVGVGVGIGVGVEIGVDEGVGDSISDGVGATVGVGEGVFTGVDVAINVDVGVGAAASALLLFNEFANEMMISNNAPAKTHHSFFFLVGFVLTGGGPLFAAFRAHSWQKPLLSALSVGLPQFVQYLIFTPSIVNSIIKIIYLSPHLLVSISIRFGFFFINNSKWNVN